MIESEPYDQSAPLGLKWAQIYGKTRHSPETTRNHKTLIFLLVIITP